MDSILAPPTDLSEAIGKHLLKKADRDAFLVAEWHPSTKEWRWWSVNPLTDGVLAVISEADSMYRVGWRYVRPLDEQPPAKTDGPSPSFQSQVAPWLQACFGAKIAGDRKERNHRFFEEAGELVQATGMTEAEAHELVDYVFKRPTGDAYQEVGGVMVTLAALCLAQGIDMHTAGDAELARVWTKIETIRAKQAAKPLGSVIPIAVQKNK